VSIAAARASIAVVRSALVPLRALSRAADEVLPAHRRGAIANAVREIEHQLGRIAIALDPSSVPQAPSGDGESGWNAMPSFNVAPRSPHTAIDEVPHA